MNPLSLVTHFAASAMATRQAQSNVCMAIIFEKINAPGEGFITAGNSLKVIEMAKGDFLRMPWYCMHSLPGYFTRVLINTGLPF